MTHHLSISIKTYKMTTWTTACRLVHVSAWIACFCWITCCRWLKMYLFRDVFFFPIERKTNPHHLADLTRSRLLYPLIFCFPFLFRPQVSAEGERSFLGQLDFFIFQISIGPALLFLVSSHRFRVFPFRCLPTTIASGQWMNPRKRSLQVSVSVICGSVSFHHLDSPPLSHSSSHSAVPCVLFMELKIWRLNEPIVMLTTNKVKQEGRTMRENRTDSCICACGAPGQCFY